MTINEMINKSILEPNPVRDNLDGTYSIKVKRLAKITKDSQSQRAHQFVKYFLTTCDVCGDNCPKRFTKKQMFTQRTYCSLICHGKMQREMNRGTKHKDNDGWRTKESYNGYMVKRIYDNPYFKQGEWVTQHRYNMTMFLGRKLLKTEVVHHIDMNKLNNHIDNLWLCNQSTHTIAHGSFNKMCAKLMENIRLYSQVKFDKYKGLYYLIKTKKEVKYV